MIMAAARHHVTIKGINDSLVFILSDQCDFEQLIEELRYTIHTSHQQILTGPDIHVEVKLGKRLLTDEEEQAIREVFKTKENLIVQSISSDVPVETDEPDEPQLRVLKGIVRSGQTIIEDRPILYVGDINPGGTIISTGDIFVLGSLRGMAHAGISGDEHAVIAASHLRPTQLRIADVISRPPDEWGIEEAFMEFAYLREGVMEIDTITQLHRIRPNSKVFKGE